MTRAHTLASNLPGFTAQDDAVIGEFAGLPITITAPSKGATEVNIKRETYGCSAPVTSASAWKRALVRLTTIHRMNRFGSVEGAGQALRHAEPGTMHQVSAEILAHLEAIHGPERALAQGTLDRLAAERTAVRRMIASPAKEPTP